MLLFLSLKPIIAPYCPKDKARPFHSPCLPTRMLGSLHCPSSPPQTYQCYSATDTTDHHHPAIKSWAQMLPHPQRFFGFILKWSLFLHLPIDHSPHTIHSPQLKLLTAINYLLCPLVVLYSLQEWGYVFLPVNPPYACVRVSVQWTLERKEM